VLRVLVGGFGEVARLGIRAILSSPEFVIDECGVESVMSAVAATRPDALVMDAGARDVWRAARVVAAYPALTVVACSASDNTMRTFPRLGGGRCLSQPLSAVALLESVRG
jgi:hypothetical protein